MGVAVVVAVINAEHLAMRDACGLVDLSAFAVFDVTGPAALECCRASPSPSSTSRRARRVHVVPRRAGRLPGGSHRHAPRAGAVPGGDRGVHGMADKSGSPTAAGGRVGPAGRIDVGIHHWWASGPRARDVLGACADGDVSGSGFAFGTCRDIEVGGPERPRLGASPMSASSDGAVCAHGGGARLWDTLYEAGTPLGLVPVGIGVYGTTGRLEKGYRAFGNELTPDYNLVEAG